MRPAERLGSKSDCFARSVCAIDKLFSTSSGLNFPESRISPAKSAATAKGYARPRGLRERHFLEKKMQDFMRHRRTSADSGERPVRRHPFRQSVAGG